MYLGKTKNSQELFQKIEFKDLWIINFSHKLFGRLVSNQKVITLKLLPSIYYDGIKRYNKVLKESEEVIKQEKVTLDQYYGCLWMVHYMSNQTDEDMMSKCIDEWRLSSVL